MAETQIRHSIIIAAPIATVWAEITRIGTRLRAQLDSVLETRFRPGDPLYYINSGWLAGAKMDKVDTTWKGILASLKSVVETGDATGRQRVTLFFMRSFMFMMPSTVWSTH